ncbi:EAL domain-containing protein [Williamsia serinedens]|uniref:EAL domain, c-di-GMP-specific phosphodiesterase class I (Or its enzymatically inactive variant) n=1 Tax=Williamsia serinedens TaxID=391736 RepID=A0ABT1H723_9NOCA|nr:EAL domain-containing protein [Williamsia serinedens]MCP2161573.1 EAL domain, c-di-GMP-specific phosphodiesterase class I (or its enzymatically inactive variant) [Williamsia serinedens]
MDTSPRPLHTDEIDARAVRDVIDNGGPAIAYQPIRRCSDEVVVGYEALSRFDHGGPPDAWFRAAAELGLSPTLEAAAIGRALAETAGLPAEVFVCVNVSPGSLLAPEVRECFANNPGRSVIVEITEGTAVEVGDAVHMALIELRSASLRVALDDVGTGHAGLRQILTVQPDLIKLDATFARGIEADPVRQAIARAMVGFARETGTLCSFEGVETEAELAGIVECGGELAQGFLLGRPGPLPDEFAKI